jgi:hypothetical protein
MFYEDYKTPAQTTVFIDEIWVDDAYYVSYELQNPRSPIFGYNQSHFGVVGDGHIIVTGQIIINFRYPGYLFAAIRDAQRRRMNLDSPPLVNVGAGIRANEPVMNRQQLRDLLNKIKDAGSTQRIKMLADSWQTSTFGQTSALMNATVTGRHGMTITAEKEMHLNPAMIPAGHGGFDIQLFYGHSRGQAVIETIESCFITGQGKTISASASGAGGPSASGTVIYEVYPFLAKKIVPQGIDTGPSIDLTEDTLLEYVTTPT